MSSPSLELLVWSSVTSGSGLNVGLSSEVWHLFLPVLPSCHQPGTAVFHVNF